MKTTVATEIADSLVRHGVEYIFGQSNPTALMLEAEAKGIRQLLYRTENAAGAMADAYARTSNKIGVVAAQNGPAAALMVAPMAEALKASIPMLVLVQEVPASQRDKNAFQELDHHTLFSGVSKWTRRLDDPNRASEYIDHAMVAANSGKPGPVVLLLAKDMLLQESIPSSCKREQSLGSFPIDRPRPEEAAVAKAAELIASANSPVIIAGGGVHSSGAVSQLKKLVETALVPIATTNMGKGSVDESHELSIGVAANFLGKLGPATQAAELIENADLVILIGTRTNENGTDAWTLTDAKAKYIHIDIDPIEISRNYESVRLLGDARSALADLTRSIASLDLSKRQISVEKVKRIISDGRATRKNLIHSLCISDASPIMPERIMSELDSLLSPEDIVVADASYSSAWVSCFLTSKKFGQRFLTPRGLAGLGWGLPFAIGAKLASPNSKVVALVGDGGFGHVWGEIEMAVREKVPVVVIVLNNAQLVMQKHGEHLGFKKTTTGISFKEVDHAAIAKAAGADGVTIKNPGDLKAEMLKALNSSKTVILDVFSSSEAFAPLRIFDCDPEAIVNN